MRSKIMKLWNKYVDLADNHENAAWAVAMLALMAVLVPAVYVGNIVYTLITKKIVKQ